MHLTGFRTAITRVLNDWARKNGYLKESEENLTGEDVREGIVVAISVKLKDPQFEGQTKAKLGNPEARVAVDAIVSAGLQDYLERNSSDARSLIEHSILVSKARKAAKAARETIIRKGILEGLSLPGKLADCSSKKPEESELFIVEGDSAGGSAKQGRDRRFQAILPLRGKILNVERARIDKMLSSKEIKALVIALGTSIGADFDIEKLRYHRVIIATDANVDGSHIRTLLLTFFFRQMKQLIERGHIYIAQPPLYRLKKGKSEKYIRDEKEFTREVMRRATEDLLITNGEGQRLERRALTKFLNDLAEYFTFFEKLEKRLRNRQVVELLAKSDLEKKADFGSPEKLQRLAKKIKEAGVSASMEFDEEHSLHELVFGNGSGTNKINWNLAALPEYRRLRALAKNIIQLDQPPFVVDINGSKVKHPSAQQLLESVLEQGKKEFTVQRYKGLGEMRADQLWETTMNAETRSLLQVRLDDAPETEQIFSTLMGDDVEVRRKFIEENALDVKNLDV